MDQPIKTQIHIAKDFSKFPCGRYASDGPASAQDLRDKLIVPALKATPTGKVLIDLDGVSGYGSSFLEEAFGGLIRESGFHLYDLTSRLEFVSPNDKTEIPRIWRFIQDASLRAVLANPLVTDTKATPDIDAPPIDGPPPWVFDGIQGEIADMGEWVLCVHGSGTWGCFHNGTYVSGDYDVVGTLESAKASAETAWRSLSRKS